MIVPAFCPSHNILTKSQYSSLNTNSWYMNSDDDFSWELKFQYQTKFIAPPLNTFRGLTKTAGNPFTEPSLEGDFTPPSRFSPKKVDFM